MLRVGGDDLDLRALRNAHTFWFEELLLQQFLQQAGAVGMKFDGE
jgi:hypothetical protein